MELERYPIAARGKPLVSREGISTFNKNAHSHINN